MTEQTGFNFSIKRAARETPGNNGCEEESVEMRQFLNIGVT